MLCADGVAAVSSYPQAAAVRSGVISCRSDSGRAGVVPGMVAFEQIAMVILTDSGGVPPPMTTRHDAPASIN